MPGHCPTSRAGWAFVCAYPYGANCPKPTLTSIYRTIYSAVMRPVYYTLLSTVHLAIMDNRVLVVASGGGHWIQMRRLQPLFDGLDAAFVSVKSMYADEVPGHRFYAVRDVTRWDRWGVAILIAQLTVILMIERPHVVITTGSAPGM